MNMGNIITGLTNITKFKDCSGQTVELQINPIVEEPSNKVFMIEREPDKELMEKLENEGMDKVADLAKNGKMFDINSLMDIIKEGAEEFKKKEGRNMSYSEMRSLYG